MILLEIINKDYSWKRGDDQVEEYKKYQMILALNILEVHLRHCK